VRPDRLRRERAEAEAHPAAGRGATPDPTACGRTVRDARHLYRQGRHREALAMLEATLRANPTRSSAAPPPWPAPGA